MGRTVGRDVEAVDVVDVRDEDELVDDVERLRVQEIELVLVHGVHGPLARDLEAHPVGAAVGAEQQVEGAGLVAHDELAPRFDEAVAGQVRRRVVDELGDIDRRGPLQQGIELLTVHAPAGRVGPDHQVLAEPELELLVLLGGLLDELDRPRPSAGEP